MTAGRRLLAVAGVLAVLAVALPATAQAATPTTVTLHTQFPYPVTAGNEPALQGTAMRGSLPWRGTPVEIRAQEWGSSSWSAVAITRTDRTGAFSALLRPQVQTRFVAVVHGTSSPSLLMPVHRRLTVTNPDHGLHCQILVPKPLCGGAVAGFLTPAAALPVVVINREGRELGRRMSSPDGRFVVNFARSVDVDSYVVYVAAHSGNARGSTWFTVKRIPPLPI